jgi:hypothetical protein
LFGHFWFFFTIARLRFWQASIAAICLLERADKTELFLDGLVFYDISNMFYGKQIKPYLILLVLFGLRSEQPVTV